MYQMCNSFDSRCAAPPPPRSALAQLSCKEEQETPDRSESIPQAKPSQAQNQAGSGFPHPCLGSLTTGMFLPRNSARAGSARGERNQLGDERDKNGVAEGGFVSEPERRPVADLKHAWCF